MDWTAVREYSQFVIGIGLFVFTAFQFLHWWLQRQHRFKAKTGVMKARHTTDPEWIVFEIQIEVIYNGPGTIFYPKACWVPKPKPLEKSCTVIPKRRNVDFRRLDTQKVRENLRLEPTDAVLISVYIPASKARFKAFEGRTLPGYICFKHGADKRFAIRHDLEFPATISVPST